MTLGRKILKRINSPVKSPKLANTSLRKKTLLKRLSSGGVQFGASSKANLKVVVRVRPENQREIDSNSRSVIDIVDDHMMIFDPKHEENDFFHQGTKQKFRDLSKKPHKEQKFIFERVFDPSSTNDDIFEITTKDIVDTILNGYNCSVFAYGATGSGKTFTMIGDEESPGITFLTVMELYKKIAELEETKTCEVGVSYLEVYNEMVRDLLNPGKPLNLHESGQHVQVSGLTLHKPKGADELLKILADGNRNRSQHPTDANSVSSRSHAVFQVFVRQQNRCSDITAGVSIAKLSMIDLAGSERGSATGFKGARFREGTKINKSLLALGNCINALADGKGHIPYRDSKLTRLLKDSIGGNCRSVMIATITRAALSFEDTYNTLRYANRAKTIKTTIKKNFMNVDQHVSQYLKIVEDLRAELVSVKEKLKSYEEKELEEDCSPIVPSDELSEGERKVLQETIQELSLQLEAKKTRSAEEDNMKTELINHLITLNGEIKSIKREILQLETAERELEFKTYVQKANLVKMNVFVFASSRLEKGIAKSERSIRTFQNNLDHILKQKEILKEKASHLKEKIMVLCDNFSKSFPKIENEEKMLPDPLCFVKDMEMEQSFRDSLQINEYFEGLVQQLYKEQTHNEKVVALLLAANKYFYLKLTTLGACDSESNQFLEKIYGMLDASRIEWADLKNTNESYGEQSIADHMTIVPPISVDKLTQFSLSHSVRFSPLLNDISKVYKSNILKAPNVSENTTSCNPVNETIIVTTPVSSRFSSLNRTPPLASEAPTTPLSSTPPPLSSTPPLTSVPPLTSNPPVMSTRTEDSILDIEALDIKESITNTTQKIKIEEAPCIINNTFTADDLNSSPIETTTLEATSGSSMTPPSPVLKNINITITLDEHCDDDVPIVDNNLPAVNETFSLASSNANSTFCVTENPNNVSYIVSPKDTENPNNASYTVSPKEPCPNIPNPQNQTFKKPFSMTPSKFSFSKLPSLGVKLSTNRSFKRSTSVTSLHNSATKSSNKENMMKKSTSFITPKFGSLTKPKDGGAIAGKTVAFGSTFSNTPKLTSSKRSLTYLPVTPQKK